jgi:hypothetical protein
MTVLPGCRSRWTAALLVATLLASVGCAVKWTPFYDDTLDKDVTSFQQSTETYLTKLEGLQAPACTYPQNLEFYQQGSVQLSVMRTRVSASPHPKQLLEILDALSRNFTDLQTLQKNNGNECLNSTVIEAARKGFEPVFESLLAYELALKANQPPATAPSK